MRPLVCTSGNPRQPRAATDGRSAASMRPLVCTSGNFSLAGQLGGFAGGASMRPLVCTSGNYEKNRARVLLKMASMRPLVCTSGNTRATACDRWPFSSFNEAAGLHQRKRRQPRGTQTR